MACGRCEAARKALAQAAAQIVQGQVTEAGASLAVAAANVGDKLAESLRIRSLTGKR